ncbi:hypothetical protein NESM_000144000 [Novymonas esmeraldas]|uniref:Proteophosphoglycan ppg4 n=1 Tax=Novymonas esmeraldas TaxID=1808958 RepID=A0AAW0F6C6_9TRYP
MADFPEWAAGEIAEDVDEFLSEGSRAAARKPVQERRQGRLPPKKKTNLSASPKALVGCVSDVQCDVMEDDLAPEGLLTPPPTLHLDGGTAGRASPLQPARVGATKVSASPATTRASAAPQPPSLGAPTASFYRRREGGAAPQHRGTAQRSRPGSQYSSPRSRAASTSPTPPSLNVDVPTKRSKSVMGASMSGASICSRDGSPTFDSEYSFRAVVPAGSAPVGLSLPGLRRQSTVKLDAPRQSFSAEAPTSLQNAYSTQARPLKGATGSRRSLTSPLHSTATPAPTTTSGDAGGGGAAGRARVRSNVAAPPSAAPTRRSLSIATAASIGRRASQHRMSARGGPQQGSTAPDQPYGSGFPFDETVSDQDRPSLAGTQTRTGDLSATSSVDYSVLRGAYDTHANRFERIRSSAALPGLRTSAAPTAHGLRGTTARAAALTALQEARPAMGPSASAVQGGAKAVPPAEGLTNGAGASKEGELSKQYGGTDAQGGDKTRKRAPHSKRELRRRGPDIDKV